MLNPFTPFQLATSEGFVNRVAETQTIFERLLKGASTGVVGNPHIGKTSLLRWISEPDVVAQHVPEPERYTFVDVDFQSFVPADDPADFWPYVVEEAIFVSPDVKSFFTPILESRAFDARRLLSAFTRLGRRGRRVVLLIDEFDYLFNLPNFRTLEFMGPLRVITMKSGGLVLVTASRLSVAQLNQQAADYKDAVRGSDLFNYLEEVSLSCFASPDVQAWLAKHFQNAETIKEIRLLAGHHPQLLQLAGEIYYGVEASSTNGARRETLRRRFIRKAETQFQDVWDYLTPKAQVALVIFALDYLGGRVPSGERLSLEEAGKYLTWYKREVNDMIRRGTLETGSSGRPSIGSLAFLHWIAENKIVGTRGDEPQEAFAQWLAEKQYKLGGLLTQEEITWLQKTWQSIPDELLELAFKTLSLGSMLG